MPLRTYLPDGDVDVSLFADGPTAAALRDSWAPRLRDALAADGARFEAARQRRRRRRQSGRQEQQGEDGGGGGEGEDGGSGEEGGDNEAPFEIGEVSIINAEVGGGALSDGWRHANDRR